jgi:pimeloyl-ACP methyl ester carboxylesterase
MNESIIGVNGVDLCTETFGNPTDPCILLIMGATASMVWWDDQFCRRLADLGRFVIRYDNRDVGRSTCYEPGTTPYSVLDMADDALGVLDCYKLPQAHLVGMSLGGMLAQLVAIRQPSRVLSLTLISSSVWDDRPELPQLDQKVLAYHAAAAALDWTDRPAVEKYLVGGWRILNGSAHPFDEQRALQLARTELSRARNLLSMFNHAALKGGESLYGRSQQIRTPTLIIHGTEDPVLPFVHAQALQATIPDSALLTLEGSGHEIHQAEWDRVIAAIRTHTESRG